MKPSSTNLLILNTLTTCPASQFSGTSWSFKGILNHNSTPSADNLGSGAAYEKAQLI